MMTGKARVLKVRETQQMLFDEYLIDEFEHGETPNPLERRAIRVVQNAHRLAETPQNVLAVVESGVIAEPSAYDASDDSACFTRIGAIEIEHPGLGSPIERFSQECDSEMAAAPIAVVEEPVSAVFVANEPQPIAVIAVESIDSYANGQTELTPEAAESEFRLLRFVQGIVVGAAAAVVFLGMVSTL